VVADYFKINGSFMKGADNEELIILEYTSFVTAVGAAPPSPTGEGYNAVEVFKTLLP
jgi:hypothetical protein